MKIFTQSKLTFSQNNNNNNKTRLMASRKKCSRLILKAKYLKNTFNANNVTLKPSQEEKNYAIGSLLFPFLLAHYPSLAPFTVLFSLFSFLFWLIATTATFNLAWLSPLARLPPSFFCLLSDNYYVSHGSLGSPQSFFPPPSSPTLPLGEILTELKQFCFQEQLSSS